MAGPPGDPAAAASRLRGTGAACFLAGLSRAGPEMTEGSLLGVGVADFDRGRTRVVGTFVPPETMREYGIKGKAAEYFTEVLEWEYDEHWVRSRSTILEEWSVHPAQRNHPMPNDPMWILGLLDSGLGYEPAVGLGYEIDPRRAPKRFPRPELSQARKMARRRRLRPSSVRVTVAADGCPLTVAASTDPYSSREAPYWRQLRFVAFGEECADRDLWEMWRDRASFLA